MAPLLGDGRWRAWLRSAIGLDLRSLAAFRIGIGSALLFDLVTRARDFTAFYTRDGVLPPEAMWELYPRRAAMSLHVLSGGDPLVNGLLFAVAGLAAVGLVAGWRTRLMTFVSWLLLVSLQRANPALQGGGDIVLRMMLFWGLFLPIGARWSADALREDRRALRPQQIASLPSAAILVQLTMVYLFAGLNKTGAAWDDGTALRNALYLEPYVRPLGHWVRDVDWFTRGLTHFTIALEHVGPFLLFVPVANGLFRVLAFALFVGFHLGIAAVMEVGIFPVSCVGAWLVVLPGSVWDRLAGRFARTRAFDVGGWVSRLRRACERVTARVPRALAPRAQALGLSRVWTAIVAVLLAYVVLSTTARLPFRGVHRLYPTRLAFLGEVLMIEQYWKQFSPEPRRWYGWFVFDGELVNGEHVDPFRNGPVDWERPDDIHAAMRNQRWHSMLDQLRGEPPEFAGRRPYFARYLIDQWNADHRGVERMVDVEIYMVLVPSLGSEMSPGKRYRIYPPDGAS